MKKVLITVMMLVVGLVMCVNFTYAASDSFKVEASADKTEIKTGETVKVTFKLKDFNLSGDTKGVISFGGEIKYDTNVFEKLTDSDIAGINGWTPYPNLDNNKVVLMGSKGIKADQEVLVITLKAKTTLTAGTTKVTLANTEGATESAQIKSNDASTPDMTVVATTTPDKPTNPDGDNNNNNNNNNNNDSNTSNNNNNSGNNNNGTNNGGITINGGNNNQGTSGTTNNSSNTSSTSNGNQATGTLPKAGAATIIPVIIVIAVIGGIAYNRYSKMKF